MLAQYLLLFLYFCGSITAPHTGLTYALWRIHVVCVDARIPGDDSRECRKHFKDYCGSMNVQLPAGGEESQARGRGRRPTWTCGRMVEG